MFFSGVTMWLKPVSGLANYTFAHLLAVKESVKNQIGNYSNTDFKINDLQQGFNEAKKLMLVDAMNGTWRNNKAFVLMDKFRYLPDNYDWFTMPNQLLTANNKLFTTRTMYMFHTIPEEYLATAMFVAQLNSMKTPDGKSVWDHYVEVKKTDANGNTYIDYEWDGTVRGQVNISNVADKPIIQDLTELSIEEINRIKFTYERIHGGYRLDERPYIEYFV